jgi:ABC-type sugar transport system ATPase subunit
LKYGISYIPRNRKVEGLFGIMTVLENLTISIVQKLSRFKFFVDIKREKRFGTQAVQDTSIKIPGLQAKVTALSGGNQDGSGGYVNPGRQGNGDRVVAGCFAGRPD